MHSSKQLPACQILILILLVISDFTPSLYTKDLQLKVVFRRIRAYAQGKTSSDLEYINYI